MKLQKNVLEYLEKTAERLPDKAAFVDEKETYTFGKTLSLSRALGTFIAKKTGAKARPVAVLTDRSAKIPVVFMGVLQSGNYYVPIDAKMPLGRMENILTQLKPALLLYGEENRETAETVSRLCPIAPMAEGFEANEDLGLLESIRKGVLDIDPVYIIFTSGSTGTPKGIVISHRSVIDFEEWMAETCELSENDILGNQAPFYFDLSVKDIYTALKCGATVHVFPQKFFIFPTLLMKYIEEKKITTLIWSTSAFHLVANSKVLEKYAPQSVKKVILGGEALQAKQLNIWRKALPNTQYINLYGPTEVTVDCTYYKIDREYRDDETIPIGKACENMEILLMDENMCPVEQGNPGEICVRGTGLARGYYGDWDKTSASFIQNPLNKNYLDIIYRTGDIAYMNDEGLLIFCSRADGQIKHMGYRIELGEVEAAVNSFEKMQAGICFFDKEKDKIVCVYQGEYGVDDLAALLRDKLPKYMIPNIFIKTERLPYNANGKIDRVELRETYFNGKDSLI